MPDLDARELRLIANFADRLVPEAFEHPYSAYDIRLPDPPGTFNQWIEARIDECLAFQYPSGGRATGMIVVESADLRATWHGCTFEGCRLSVEAEVARDEVRHFDQPWVFAIDTWGPQESWVCVEDPDTGLVDEVLTHPQPVWHAQWYAEARGRGAAQVRTGVVVLDLWTRIGTAALPKGTQLERDARKVLFRHPDRRRHRLRSPRTT